MVYPSDRCMRSFMDLNYIHLGDCLDILKTLPTESLDSCVSDVPYGLGAREPTPQQISDFLTTGLELGTKDFMGNDWEIPTPIVWQEVYRVLKPGAYVIAFGGTRTFDLVSLGLRMAGFECRDTLADEFPVTANLPILQWVYGTGMPKSHNVSKRLDKMQGITQEGGPITADAIQWEGFGSGLKPAWEPILVFRKPFKTTLAKNVLEHGTGAFNIDATRVKHASAKDFEAHKAQVEAVKSKGGVRGDSWKNSSDLSGANDVKEGGRWPANLLLSHSDECEQIGTVTTKAPTAGRGDLLSHIRDKTTPTSKPSKLGDADGNETNLRWECVLGCPVAELDAQSGDRPSTLTGRADPNASHKHPGSEMNPNSTFLGERVHLSRVYADTGGASRFFTQFEGIPFRYTPKANRKDAGAGVFKVEHPTIKPVPLMRWLIRLVTPPGGVVLDPYCGSGSTCHAALLEGMQYVGIERYPSHHAEASRRLRIIQERLEEETLQEEMMAFAAEAAAEGEPV